MKKKEQFSLYTVFLSFVAIILLGLAIWWYTKLFPKKSEEEKLIEDSGTIARRKETVEVIKAIDIKGSGLTDSQALMYANQLEEAMQRNSLGEIDGTDEATIRQIIVDNAWNGQNLAHIYKKFGFRLYDTGLFSAGELKDLFAWFKAELTNGEYQQLKNGWNWRCSIKMP